jgi:hypothetical protein
MITQTQYDKVAASLMVKEYSDKVTAFKDYLKSLNLTYQVDYDMIELEFKTQLFTKLMAVDKGLALEFNTLLKTNEAKAAKINQKIDLDGYSEPVAIKAMIAELQFLHNKVFTTSKDYGHITYNKLVTDFAGDPLAFIKLSVIDWTGLEKHKELFDNYFTALTALVPVFRDELGYSTSNGNTVVGELLYVTDWDYINDKFVGYSAKEVALHYKLKQLKK